MISVIPADLAGFTFIDLGSGKGRTLVMAAEHGFRRIIGVELLPELNEVARRNIERLKTSGQLPGDIETICADARDFDFPCDPTVLYLFNPFTEAILLAVVARLEHSIQQNPRAVYVVYHNPILEHVFAHSTLFKKLANAQYYSIWEATTSPTRS